MAQPKPARQRWNWTAFASRGDQLLILLSLLIGVIVGLTTVAFILLTGRLAARMYPPGSDAWRRIFVPTAGALFSGYLLYRYFPNARGSGIPQAKFALFIRDGYISLRTVLGKFLCCSISLASGIALGREGPSVQIGAGIASVIGRRFGLSPANMRALLPVGCSAALAAAFNTPIAAVLFSLEEILGDFHAPVLGSIVLSSATSWMVLHLILGDQPLFHAPAYQLVNPVEFAIYAVLGIAGGLGSVAFVKLLLYVRLRFRALPRSTVWVQPAIGGLAVGLMGWYIPEVLGVGYDYVDRVLGGDFPVKTVAILAVLKLIATPVCYGTGNAGGIFGPSLFIGAMIGGAVGSVAHSLLPGLTANPGAYALVGMGAAFAGIVRTPMTSVIMIFEMTRDYTIIVPLMIANMISFVISRVLQPEPIYEALALQEGVHLPTAESRGEFAGNRVGEIMDREARPLPMDAPVEEAKEFLTTASVTAWPVGEARSVTGLLNMRQLENADHVAGTLRDLLPGQQNYPHAHTDHQVSYVLDRMRGEGVDALPVVSRANVHELQGIVTLSRILASYGIQGKRVPPSMQEHGLREKDLLLSAANPVTLPAGAGRPLLGFLAILALVVAGLTGLDQALARIENAEIRNSALRNFESGKRLLDSGQAAAALEPLRQAHALERENSDYTLALITALMDVGKADEAESLMNDILAARPNDGNANLVAARLMDKQGRAEDAEAYYHRAIYGTWNGDAMAQRRAARLELIRLLVRENGQQQLLAELISLEAESGNDRTLQMKIADLFLLARSPARASAIYRKLVEEDPKNSAAYAGLGEAELQQGEYRAAQTAFLRAANYRPEGPLASRLRLLAELNELDPTPRRLTSLEKYNRSLRILGLAKSDLEAHLASQAGPVNPENTALLKSAGDDLARTPPHMVTNEMAEHELDLAERIWKARIALFGRSTSPEEEPLRLCMEKLVQAPAA